MHILRSVEKIAACMRVVDSRAKFQVSSSFKCEAFMKRAGLLAILLAALTVSVQGQREPRGHETGPDLTKVTALIRCGAAWDPKAGTLHNVRILLSGDRIRNMIYVTAQGAAEGIDVGVSPETTGIELPEHT